MPENYVAMFYVPGAEESAQIIAAAQPTIDGGIACVQRGEPFPAPRVGLLDRFKTGPVNTIFYRWFVKSGPFTVSDACIGCGKCALSCPVNGIDIVERRPALERRVHALHGLHLRLPGVRHRVRA